MSVRDYIEAFAPPPKELRAMQATAKRTGTSKMSREQIDKVVTRVRKEHVSTSGKRRRR